MANLFFTSQRPDTLFGTISPLGRVSFDKMSKSYVFELEAGDGDIEIAITPDGVLSMIGNENGGGNGHIIGELDPVILGFINTNYPGTEFHSANFPNTKTKMKIRSLFV